MLAFGYFFMLIFINIFGLVVLYHYFSLLVVECLYFMASTKDFKVPLAYYAFAAVLCCLFLYFEYFF